MYNSIYAVKRLMDKGDFGCYTLVEIPPIDFVKGNTVNERLQRIRY
jgi:hypothetical protein